MFLNIKNRQSLPFFLLISSVFLFLVAPLSLHQKFDFLTKKALNYYFDLNKQRITWTYTNIRFHKIEPGDWELHDKKHTRIHKDNAFLGGVIYLNKGENDEETGTSFFDDNLNRMYSVNNYYNNAVFFQGCRLNHGATGINNNKERLIINFFMDDIQYKYMD